MARMTPRERLLAAYQHLPVDRIPCSPRIWAWLKEHYGECDAGSHLRAAKEFDFDPHMVFDPFQNAFDIRLRESYDLPDVQYSLEACKAGAYRVVRRIFETPTGMLTDVTQVPPAGDRTYGINPTPVRTEFLCKTKDDLTRLRHLVSDPERADWDGFLAVDQKVGEEGLLMLPIRSALCGRGGEALAMEELMIMFHEDREFFEEYCRLFHEVALAEIRAALRAGVRHFLLNWFYNSLSAGWSPTIWKESFHPQLKETCDLIHNGGGTANYYDDGRCMGIIDLLADAGIDVLQTLTPPPVGDADLAELKRRIGGRVCLMGHTDLIYVLQKGTPELIDRTVREAIEVAGPTGFILGTSDSIRDGTPMENVRAYFDAAHSYGKMN